MGCKVVSYQAWQELWCEDGGWYRSWWELVLIHVRLCRSQFTVVFRVYDFTIWKVRGWGVIQGRMPSFINDWNKSRSWDLLGDEKTQVSLTSLISFGMEPGEQNLAGDYLCQICLRVEGSDVHSITNIQDMTATTFSLMQCNHVRLGASEAHTV
jgi:hypothetical protein